MIGGGWPGISSSFYGDAVGTNVDYITPFSNYKHHNAFDARSTPLDNVDLATCMCMVYVIWKRQ